MEIKLPHTTLVAWFDRLVKNKMAGVAVSVSGIAISCFLLTFAKLFSDFIFDFVTGVGIVLLANSAGLFAYSSVRQVAASFNGSRRRSIPVKSEADQAPPAASSNLAG
jgi:hypothetical protein